MLLQPSVDHFLAHMDHMAHSVLAMWATASPDFTSAYGEMDHMAHIFRGKSRDARFCDFRGVREPRSSHFFFHVQGCLSSLGKWAMWAMWATGLGPVLHRGVQHTRSVQ
jgi:hypothetical protein